MSRPLQLAWLCAALAVLAFGVGAWMGKDSQLVQRVQPATQAESSLFGDSASASTPGTPIGSPQQMIIRDQAAFLPGSGEGGVRYVSDTYLTEKGIYPLQLKTVNLFRNAATLGFLALAALLALWHTRQSRRAVVQVPAG